MDGLTLAYLGVAIAVGLTGIGTAIAVSTAVRAASGVLSEKPNEFGRLLILVAITTTNGIYGFLVGVLILTQTPILGGADVIVTQADGIRLLMSSIPIGIVGCIAAIAQARAAASAIYMTGKKPELSARGIVLVSLIETYPILALLVSVLMIFV